jgi:serine/threonine-protein kinase
MRSESSEGHSIAGGGTVSLGRIADYTLLSELGQGGMSKVFLATSAEGGEVALKTILFPEGLDARGRWETVERFQREARAARSLEHPNICQVLDVGADQETFFIVMELLRGQTLREAITAVGAIKAERAVSMVEQVCDALAYAHAKGIVHRDIKPENIMLLEGDAVRLMDFGIASIIRETSVTQTGMMVGTLSYMSPEQARGEKLDARSDIFSLGATFYEMLTGQKPFHGDTPTAILHSILNDDPEPPADTPRHIARTVAKCLRKRPSYRFQDVGEIITSLKASAGPAPTQATMVSPRKRPAAVPPDAQASSDERPRTSPSAGRAVGDARDHRSAPRARALPSDLRCPSCNEPLAANTPTCWRCGTPNPAIASRKATRESQTSIARAVQDYRRTKKKGWFRKRR